MNSKHCPHCDYTEVIRFGKVVSKNKQGKPKELQRYYCKRCGKTWTNTPQPKRKEQRIWDDYVRGGKSIEKLAKKYKCSRNTICKILHHYPLPKLHPHGPADVIVMDATYFGRKWGILLVLNAISGEPLYCARIGAYERVIDYWSAIYELRKQGIVPKACIIDGKKGVREMLLKEGLLVQICQFHQIQIVVQNLTRNPDLKPNQELLELAKFLPHATYEQFAIALGSWQLEYGHWINERTYSPDNPRHYSYTHPKSRRAFCSLRRNKKYLFTYEAHPELNIPKTSNIIEGRFGVIKTKLVCHRGCSDEMKWKLFLDLLINGTK